MSKYFLYSDAESKEVLESSASKVLLVGGCFGASNFGDILQLKGAVNFHKNLGKYEPVPIFSMSQIDGPDFIANAKKVFGVKAILFLSESRIKADFLNLSLAQEFSLVELLHFYGSGSLNDKWGDFILSVLEFLLQELEIQRYIISGQQVDQICAEKTAIHIRHFKPALIGVRDFKSANFLLEHGVTADFSFDDAFNELAVIASKISRKGNTGRALIHLNFSTYTNNVKSEAGLISILQEVRNEFSNDITVFNAFNEIGFELIDSLRAIAHLGNRFPFEHFRVINGPALAYGGMIDDKELFNVDIAISCSYHVAMFMHLLGVPCYLSTSNGYYDQKREALECPEDFIDFFKNRRVPDYSQKIQARERWLAKLKEYLEVSGHAGDVHKRKRLEFSGSENLAPFQYKTDGLVEQRDRYFRIERRAEQAEMQCSILLNEQRNLRLQRQAAMTENELMRANISQLRGRMEMMQRGYNRYLFLSGLLPAPIRRLVVKARRKLRWASQ